MRKSKKTKATYDAIGSLDPTEAGELLSAGGSSTTIDWKNHDLPSYPDIFIGDPPDTLGGGSTSPYGPTIINPTIGGRITGTFTTVNVSELEDRIKKLEEIVAVLQVELAEAKRRGGFWRRPNI